jgi:hypothetical protein
MREPITPLHSPVKRRMECTLPDAIWAGQTLAPYLKQRYNERFFHEPYRDGLEKASPWFCVASVRAFFIRKEFLCDIMRLL